MSLGKLLPEKRFQMVSAPGLSSGYLLMIEDYMWWTTNEREILNWMADNLPHGIDHQQGMFVYFPTDNDRIAFLLKWG